MDLVKASVSTLVVEPTLLKGKNVLAALEDGQELPRTNVNSVDDDMVGGFAEIAAQQMKLLEDDSDFLQLSSRWQQRLAFTVKADTLTSFLCCTLLNDEIADPEVLMNTLENSLNDPVEMSDAHLATVVLRSLAILAKTSTVIATGLSRSLPRFIVQSGLTRETASIAAKCLSSILNLLPQDVVISTLYSLGNAISAGSTTDRNLTSSPFPDGGAKVNRSNGPYIHQLPGSSISLSLSDPEETSVAYGIVIQTITQVASSCKDEKITALAQSMLIQKLGRVNLPVDATIIAETAVLGVHSGLNEFRSLLKLYAKLSHDGLVQENAVIVKAVSSRRLQVVRYLLTTKSRWRMHVNVSQQPSKMTRRCL